MELQEKLYTVAEFRAYIDELDDENKRFELEHGVIVEVASSKGPNTVIAARVIHYLNAWIIPRDLGWVTAPDGGFMLGPQLIRQPDTAFISKKRLPELPDDFDMAPDLAVEVVSPNEDVFKKVNEYLGAGTQLVWVIYPREKVIYVIWTDDGQMISVPHYPGDILDGGNVLPGFKLPVIDCFP